MNNIIAAFALVFLMHNMTAQSLELQVIGSSGNYSTAGSGSSLSATVGEPVTETFSNGIILTQGFQQSFILITAVNSPIDNNILIYPNPASSTVSIETSGGEDYSLELLDVLGERLIFQKLQGTMNTINLERLSPATYFIKVYSQEQIQQTFKLVKYK